MLYTKSNSFNSVLKEERFLRSHYIENFKLGVGEILHAQVGDSYLLILSVFGFPPLNFQKIFKIFCNSF